MRNLLALAVVLAACIVVPFQRPLRWSVVHPLGHRLVFMPPEASRVDMGRWIVQMVAAGAVSVAILRGSRRRSKLTADSPQARPSGSSNAPRNQPANRLSRGLAQVVAWASELWWLGFGLALLALPSWEHQRAVQAEMRRVRLETVGTVAVDSAGYWRPFYWDDPDRSRGEILGKLWLRNNPRGTPHFDCDYFLRFVDTDSASFATPSEVHDVLDSCLNVVEADSASAHVASMAAP